MLFSNMSQVITIFFWVLIYQGDSTRNLNGFTLHNIITYFIIGGIFRIFIFQSSGFQYSQMIKDGSLGPALLKPYRISMVLYFKNLAVSVTGIIPQVTLLMFLLPFISKYLTWNFRLENIVFVFLFIVIESVSSHLLWSLFGYMAFWFEESNAVMWSFAVLLNMATGMFMPLDFFPKWSLAVLEVLPFASWGYIPTKTYLGLYTSETLFSLFLIHVLWIGILFLANKFFWKKGIRKYSSVGG
jgi:ABC-2 type transport system permease protein